MPDTPLSDDAQHLRTAIARLQLTTGEPPTRSTLVAEGPFGWTKTERLLGVLLDHELASQEVDERAGNEVTVYRVLRSAASPPSTETKADAENSALGVLLDAVDATVPAPLRTTLTKCPASATAAICPLVSIIDPVTHTPTPVCVGPAFRKEAATNRWRHCADRPASDCPFARERLWQEEPTTSWLDDPPTGRGDK